MKKQESNIDPTLQNLTAEQVEKMSDDELEHLGDKKKGRPKRRKLTGKLGIMISVIAICMSCFHLYAAIFTMSPMLLRAFHLSFVLPLIFLLYPATRRSPKNRPSVLDCILAVIAVFVVGNVILNFERLTVTGGRGNTSDFVCGIITILLILEAGRRVVGFVLPTLAVIALSYGFWGAYITGPLKHAGFSINRIIQHLTLTTEGVYGSSLGVSATYIFLFILFGAFLGTTGMSSLFNDISIALAGSLRGGPAKVSVLASGLMGSISGSASANVATTGVFTIPLMRKTGYKDYFASAVEAVASTGGQIMPPIMGSAAFLIADALGVPFLTIARSALLPAVLYYVCLWIMVDLRARKTNLYGLDKSELPSLKKALLEKGHLLIPLIGVIIMIIVGYNAMRAAVTGIVLSVVSSFLRRSTWVKPKDLIKALSEGAQGALQVAGACAVVGIVIGMISLSGAIIPLGAAIIKASGGVLLTSLVLTMLTSIVMGMGLPTTAVYILTSTVSAPVLTSFGIPALAAHMFVFYYGILSAITPPVCGASYTASGLSGANPNQTGIAAVRLGLTGFIIPFMFVYSPELLLPEGLSIPTTIRIITTSLIGIYALSMGIEGFFYRKLNVIERIACFVGAVMLINSNVLQDVIGLAIIAAVVALQLPSRKGFVANENALKMKKKGLESPTANV